MYEAVAGAKVVKAFHRERYHERQLFHNMRETLESRIKIMATQTAMGRVALFFPVQSAGLRSSVMGGIW